jgi:hypothetical protein
MFARNWLFVSVADSALILARSAVSLSFLSEMSTMAPSIL